MKLGIVLPQRGAGPGELLGAARAAEAAGLDSIWVEDHPFGRTEPNSENHLEGWTALAAAAAVTQRVMIGTLVLRVGLRNPRLLVSMAQTLYLISEGRLIIGLGIGDAASAVEQRIHGIDFPPRSERVKELRRTIEMLKEALPNIPVWIGGSSDELLEILPLADGWNCWGSPERFPEAADRARRAGAKQVSWGGMAQDFDPSMLEKAGAAHAIIATGAKNYQQRINQLQELPLSRDR